MTQCSYLKRFGVETLDECADPGTWPLEGDVREGGLEGTVGV